MSNTIAVPDGAVERPSPTASPSPSRAAISVVSKFVKRYYALVDPAKNADLAQFYQDDSSVTRGDFGAEPTTGRGAEQGVNVASARPYQSRDSVSLFAADFQESAERDISLLVNGTLVNLDGVSRRFVQSIYLAVVPGSEQETVPRYYVRHDILRYLDALTAPVTTPAPVVVAPVPAPVPAPKEVAPAPAAVAVIVAAPTPVPQTVEEKVETKPVEQPTQPAAAATSDDKGKRAPRPRNPKKEGAPNGAANGNGKSSPKADRKEESAKPAPAPATWAQRLTKAPEVPKPAESSASPAATPATTAPTAAPLAAKPATESAPSKSAAGPAKTDNRAGNNRRESPKTSEKSGSRRPEQRGEARTDDSRSLVVRNVPYEVTETEPVRALLLKPAPEGLGLGAELSNIELKKGMAVLSFSTTEHAQRVLRLSQTAKLMLGGRELRVEARNSQRPRQGAPQ